jgi:hypothetical protein
MVTKGKTITREDIRHLLQNPTTQLANIIVSNGSGGDGTQQTHGERYDYSVDELSNELNKATEVNDALQLVLQKLKQSCKKIKIRLPKVAKYVHWAEPSIITIRIPLLSYF